MRTSSFFIIALFFSFFLATSCQKDILDPNPTPTPDLPLTSTQFKNTLHQTFGAATLKAENNHLTVSNIGSSGQDGVNIFLPPNQSADVFFKPVAAPDAGGMTVSAFNSENGTTYSAMRLAKNGDQTALEAYIGHGQPITITAYLDGKVVHQETIKASGKKSVPWLLIGVGLYVLDHVSAHCNYNSQSGWDAGVDWNGKSTNGIVYTDGSAVDVSFNSVGESMKVDAIIVSTPSTEAYNPTSDKYAMQLKGKKLDAFTITEEVFYTPEPPTNIAVPKWILGLGHTVAGSVQCEGFGFCNSTFPPSPFDVTQLAYNEVLVSDGVVEKMADDNLLFHISNRNNGMNDYFLETAAMVARDGSYTNPSDFVLPQQFVKAVFNNAQIEVPQQLLISEGLYPAEVVYGPTGEVVAIKIIITIKIGKLTIIVIIDIC